jgi:lipopolysaccharide transport system permease protein
MVPEKYMWWYKLNPMIGLIQGYRSALFGYDFEWSLIYWSLIISIIVFLFGFLVFKKLENIFADIV